jgi:hypothetical protein
MPNVNEGFSDKSINVFGGLAWTRYLSCAPDRSKIGVNLANRDTDRVLTFKLGALLHLKITRSVSGVTNGKMYFSSCQEKRICCRHV